MVEFVTDFLYFHIKNKKLVLASTVLYMEVI